MVLDCLQDQYHQVNLLPPFLQDLPRLQVALVAQPVQVILGAQSLLLVLGLREDHLDLQVQ